MPESKRGKTVLSAQQLERVVRAAIVGYGGTDCTEARVQAIVTWAEQTMVNTEMLAAITDGRTAVRKKGGVVLFRDTDQEEARYILEGDGSTVEIETQP